MTPGGKQKEGGRVTGMEVSVVVSGMGVSVVVVSGMGS